MMARDMSMTEAPQALTSPPERLEGERLAVAVTRRGKRVLAVMPWELYEAIAETLEILGDAELTVALRRGLADASEGRVTAWDEVNGQLDL